MSCEFVRVKLSKTRPYVRQTFYDHRSIDICVDKLSDDQLVDLFNSIEISEEHPQDQRTLSRRLEKPKDTEVKVIRRAKENKYVASVDWKIELSRFEKRYAAPDPNEDELEPIRIEEYDEVDSNDELTFCEQKKRTTTTRLVTVTTTPPIQAHSSKERS
ncbi:hypothetical protein M3Y94_00800900 [Aphelenchoides besseyi]|nr:hypothetical protein M3Y94_00800900 [Aphelenchoides besseyi]